MTLCWMGCGREAKYGGGREQPRCCKMTSACPQFKARTMAGRRGTRNWGSFAAGTSRFYRSILGNAKTKR